MKRSMRGTSAARSCTGPMAAHSSSGWRHSSSAHASCTTSTSTAAGQQQERSSSTLREGQQDLSVGACPPRPNSPQGGGGIELPPWHAPHPNYFTGTHPDPPPHRPPGLGSSSTLCRPRRCMLRSRRIISRVLSCLGLGRLQVRRRQHAHQQQRSAAGNGTASPALACISCPRQTVLAGSQRPCLLASLDSAAALSAAALASWRSMMPAWRCTESSWACRKNGAGTQHEGRWGWKGQC